MERLLLLLNSLPKVLQDLIGEYNVEHRQKMKTVLSELTKCEINRGICEGCDIGKVGIPLYTLCPFEFICSKKCIKLYASFIPDECPDKSYYEELSRKCAG